MAGYCFKCYPIVSHGHMPIILEHEFFKLQVATGIHKSFFLYSRVFIKILFQELAEYMGLPKLNERLKDP